MRCYVGISELALRDMAQETDSDGQGVKVPSAARPNSMHRQQPTARESHCKHENAQGSLRRPTLNPLHPRQAQRGTGGRLAPPLAEARRGQRPVICFDINQNAPLNSSNRNYPSGQLECLCNHVEATTALLELHWL